MTKKGRGNKGGIKVWLKQFGWDAKEIKARGWGEIKMHYRWRGKILRLKRKKPKEKFEVVPRWNDKKFRNEESVEERKGKILSRGENDRWERRKWGGWN